MGKLLIVDDDNRNIFALKATLKSLGHECISAADAREAYNRLIQYNDIQLILLDMMMPDMDGYEAMPYLRSVSGYRDVVIIAVTAQAMVGDREKCLAAGANEYISKPIDVDILKETLNRYL